MSSSLGAFRLSGVPSRMMLRNNQILHSFGADCVIWERPGRLEDSNKQRSPIREIAFRNAQSVRRDVCGGDTIDVQNFHCRNRLSLT